MRRSHARTRVDFTRNNQMDPLKLQIRPNSRSSLFFAKPKATKFNFIPVFLGFVLALIAILSCYYLFGARGSLDSRKTYGIIIDGGSTGTRIHVFAYQIDGGKPVFDFGDGAMRVNPGLSSYAEDPEGAGRSLEELVEFGRRRVPKKLQGETEIRLMATAGMRLLDLEIQERILESCRKVLRKSGFKFKNEWASVITGSDEGVYAWVAANYALGSLGGDPRQTTGIIELGGASAQVTFVSNEPVPPEFSCSVKFGNVTYNIYSHSFLHFGQNAAYESLKESIISLDHDSASKSLVDPCTPKGYSHDIESWKISPSSKDSFLYNVHSGGNFSECRSFALKLLQNGKGKCSYQDCSIGSTFIPKLQGKFLATENFYHTSKFFGLGPRAFLSDLIMAGEHFCGEDWSRLKKKHHLLDDDDLMRYCFSSAYIVALLHDSLGVALDDERIKYVNNVESLPLDWALGSFILRTTAALDVQHPDWITTIITEDSPTLISLTAGAALLIFIAWSISKWRKPQLRIIYDLEKGRYIVTRVGRS